MNINRKQELIMNGKATFNIFFLSSATNSFLNATASCDCFYFFPHENSTKINHMMMSRRTTIITTHSENKRTSKNAWKNSSVTRRAVIDYQIGQIFMYHISTSRFLCVWCWWVGGSVIEWECETFVSIIHNGAWMTFIPFYLPPLTGHIGRTIN